MSPYSATTRATTGKLLDVDGQENKRDNKQMPNQAIEGRGLIVIAVIS